MYATPDDIVHTIQSIIRLAGIYTARPIDYDDISKRIRATTDYALGMDDAAKAYLLKNGPSSMGSSIYLKWEISFGAECSLTIDTRTGVRTRSRKIIPIDDKDLIPTLQLSCEINWPATQRTVSEAVASLSLYGKVVSVAASIESIGVIDLEMLS